MSCCGDVYFAVLHDHGSLKKIYRTMLIHVKAELSAVLFQNLSSLVLSFFDATLRDEHDDFFRSFEDLIKPHFDLRYFGRENYRQLSMATIYICLPIEGILNKKTLFEFFTSKKCVDAEDFLGLIDPHHKEDLQFMKDPIIF